MPSNLSMFQRSQAAFTLIELSIVLVIIGLVIGGVLFGQTLINAAKLKNQIAQLDSYAMATNAFRLKYNYLPGDLPAADASNLGFINRTGNAGSGDGNGLIEFNSLGGGYNGVPGNGNALQGELVFFWTDLSSAKFIGNEFTESGDVVVICNPGFCPKGYGAWLPESASIGGSYIIAYTNFDSAVPNHSGIVFEIIALNGISSNGQVHTAPAMSVNDAYNIDVKLDDGYPLAGISISSKPGIAGQQSYVGRNSEDGFGAQHGNSPEFCVADTSPLTYNLPYPDAKNCSLMVGYKL